MVFLWNHLGRNRSVDAELEDLSETFATVCEDEKTTWAPHAAQRKNRWKRDMRRIDCRICAIIVIYDYYWWLMIMNDY